MHHSGIRAIGLLLGYSADRLIGDPRRHHPVAGFGSVAEKVEKAIYADTRRRGGAYVVLLVGGATAAAFAAERASRRHSAIHLTLVAATTWAVLGGKSLERESHSVLTLLETDDLEAARVRVGFLVGRDTSNLDRDDIARAVVESVAENTSDAVVAPLVWGAAAGVPGLVAHRCANTLDAMVGYRNPRYRHFGWSAARLDDLLGLPGARLTGLLASLIGPDRRGAWRAWYRDARNHPSPNAGVVEASFAGALHLRLGGINSYGGTDEQRATMGHGRVPTPSDIRPTSTLARRVGHGAIACTTAALLVATVRARCGTSFIHRMARVLPATQAPRRRRRHTPYHPAEAVGAR